MDDRAYFKSAWEATQVLVADRMISAGHDVSDGGVVTAVLEMAFPSPTAGVSVTLPAAKVGPRSPRDPPLYNRPISVYRFPHRALTLCPQLCMGI